MGETSEMGEMGGAGGARRPREVAAALVIHAGRVLVQTRPAGRSWQGTWEFPGGKLEPGEEVRACAEREVLEEVGLVVTAGALLHDITWEYPGALVHVNFVLCTPHGAAAGGVPEARPLEAQSLCWAGPEDLQQLDFLPANASLLPLLMARLRLTCRGA